MRNDGTAMIKPSRRNALLGCLSMLIVAAAWPLCAADFLFTWDSSPLDAGLNAYRVYQRAGNAPYELLAEVELADLENPAHPGYLVTGLQSGSVYHFAAASVKASGEESALSDPTCVTVNGKAAECEDRDQDGAVIFINCFISALSR